MLFWGRKTRIEYRDDKAMTSRPGEGHLRGTAVKEKAVSYKQHNVLLCIENHGNRQGWLRR